MAEEPESDGKPLIAVSDEEAKRRIDSVFEQAYEYIEES